MVGMPWALAFCATVPPTSELIEAMIRTLTPSLIMPSARVENFCTSPWAFSMWGSRPWALSAASSIGRSKPSHRADEAVSGRITPTGMPPADEPVELWPPSPEFELLSWLAPHADTARVRPMPAAMRASLVLRIQTVPSRSVLAARANPSRNVAVHNICPAKLRGNPRASSERHSLATKRPYAGHAVRTPADDHEA